MVERGEQGDDADNQHAIAAWAAANVDSEGFGDEVDFTRQQLLNPVLFALLGPVEGRAILDAGCGNGYLCRLLAQRGARVTGVEPASPWYHAALKREQSERLGITYLQTDLSTLETPTQFDAVVANMVLMDIPRYEAAIRRCVAALVPGGAFIVSLTHPCFEEPSAAWADKGCVEVREYLAAYPIPQTIGLRFHRPVSHYLNQVIDAGCRLRRIVEPHLDAAWGQHGPAYERNVHVPSVIVIHATKV